MVLKICPTSVVGFRPGVESGIVHLLLPIYEFEYPNTWQLCMWHYYIGDNVTLLTQVALLTNHCTTVA